jgi:hypothetical protein
MKNAFALPGDEHRQEVQRQADAVETDGVGRLDRPDPVVGGEELLLGALAVVELCQRVDADKQGGRRSHDRGALDHCLFALWDEQHHQHAGQRQERAEAQQPLFVLEYFHGFL